MGDNYLREQSNFTSERTSKGLILNPLILQRRTLSPKGAKYFVQGHTANCRQNQGWKSRQLWLVSPVCAQGCLLLLLCPSFLLSSLGGTLPYKEACLHLRKKCKRAAWIEILLSLVFTNSDSLVMKTLKNKACAYFGRGTPTSCRSSQASDQTHATALTMSDP